jgi:hypothetical protein
MKRKRILLILLALIIIIQFVPADLPEVTSDNPNDLFANNEIPENIENLIRTTCYDCHSNETVYPWYSYVAPVSFLISKDTREGRHHLNFSEWEKMDSIEKAEALDDIAEEVEEGEMPMKIYPIIHSDAKLSDADRHAIEEWAEKTGEELFD